MIRRHWLVAMALASVTALSGCGYNDFQRLDEQVKSAWSEVVNQYQRRADLIPNIVATVKGEAQFEQDTLTRVVEARAKATSIQATPELVNNPEAFDKFQKAQGELTGALSRLMVVSERYPDLKANKAFQDLRAELAGTENRITVARNRFIKSVADYNTLARSFPSNLTAMAFSYEIKPTFTVQNEAAISAPPVVEFDKPASKRDPPLEPPAALHGRAGARPRGRVGTRAGRAPRAAAVGPRGRPDGLPDARSAQRHRQQARGNRTRARRAGGRADGGHDGTGGHLLVHAAGGR